MSAPGQDETPTWDGPDPHNWPQADSKMWGVVLDIEVLSRVIGALEGPVHREDALVHDEARKFLDNARSEQRAALSVMILHAYHVPLPEETTDFPTEAVGGPRGNGNGPGDRDHL